MYFCRARPSWFLHLGSAPQSGPSSIFLLFHLSLSLSLFDFGMRDDDDQQQSHHHQTAAAQHDDWHSCVCGAVRQTDEKYIYRYSVCLVCLAVAAGLTRAGWKGSTELSLWRRNGPHLLQLPLTPPSTSNHPPLRFHDGTTLDILVTFLYIHRNGRALSETGPGRAKLSFRIEHLLSFPIDYIQDHSSPLSVC